MQVTHRVKRRRCPTADPTKCSNLCIRAAQTHSGSSVGGKADELASFIFVLLRLFPQNTLIYKTERLAAFTCTESVRYPTQLTVFYSYKYTWLHLMIIFIID